MNSSAAWDCPGTVYAIDYGSGISVILTPNTHENPAQMYSTMAAAYPEFSVGEVLGVPAQLATPKGDPEQTAKGGVDFVLQGIRIQVIGTGDIPLDQLREIAETVRASD